MSRMSQDMVKQYVADKFAQAVSAGVMHGETLPANGHTHRYAVMYDDLNQMFVGETAMNGSGPHTHYIMVSVYDVVNSSVDPVQKTEEEITAIVHPTNMPANMRRIIDFYNLKEIRIKTRFSGGVEDDEHQHELVLRYAGHEMDKLGRKTTASDFSKGLEATKEHDAKLAEVKEKAKNAEAHVEKVLREAIKNAKK